MQNYDNNLPFFTKILPFWWYGNALKRKARIKTNRLFLKSSYVTVDASLPSWAQQGSQGLHPRSLGIRIHFPELSQTIHPI